MKNILVLCTGNSCRSQIAEGYLKQYLNRKAVVFSAGAVSYTHLTLPTILLV